jgi:ferric-dicitrate binding protein FerR (iron transport regulator)
MNYDNHPSPREIKNLIIKFLQKEASETELKLLESWLKERPENRKQFDEINDTFQAAVSLQRFTPQKVDDAWQSFTEKIKNEQRETVQLHTRPTFWLRIAASFLLFICVGTLLWRYAPEHTVTGSQSRVANNATNKTHLVLPDGSLVWLNANSSITYEADFGIQSRKVTLKGEAFFNVTKGEKEFIVTTNNLSIRVKGTRFNVNTQSLDGNERTTLEEGLVELQIKGNTTTYDMRPGDQVIFHSDSKKVTVKKVNPSHYSAWKEESLRFENESLGEIAKQLENRFNVTIELDSALAQKENLTMTITDESVEEVMELIRLSSTLKFKVLGNHITIYE